MKVMSRFLLVLAAVFALTNAAQAETFFTGTLNSAQEVPSNSSTAVGFGRVTLNDAETQITVSLNFSGLGSNQVASHIHAPAPRGVNSPVLFNIGSTGATTGTFTALSFAVNAAQVADLKAGLWYFNIHSANFTGGEIRGQIEADSPFVSTFSSNQEVPVNNSTATGRGNVSLNATGTQIIGSLQFSGLSSNQVASHIHGSSRPGVNSPVLFNFGATNATSGGFTDLFFNVTPAQAAALKSGQLYFNVHSANFTGGEIRGQIQRRSSTVMDYDGDAKTDFVVVRNNSGSLNWYVNQSGSANNTVTQFGSGTTDFSLARLVGGDYDGDGKDDLCIWRANPNGDPLLSNFYVINSFTNTFRAVQFGSTGDDPRVVEDYDGDGRTDFAVYRDGTASATQSNWFYIPSANNAAQNFVSIPWGTDNDFAAPGDYDGDGKGDFCVQRTSTANGVFWCLNTTTGIQSPFQYGLSSDFIAPGDYDGDGKTDIAAVRTVGSERRWYIRGSLNPSANAGSPISWGVSTAARTQGDYDGDGKTDVAVWQPTNSQNAYWVRQSSNNQTQIFPWGLSSDLSVNAYNVR